MTDRKETWAATTSSWNCAGALTVVPPGPPSRRVLHPPGPTMWGCQPPPTAHKLPRSMTRQLSFSTLAATMGGHAGVSHLHGTCCGVYKLLHMACGEREPASSALQSCIYVTI